MRPVLVATLTATVVLGGISLGAQESTRSLVDSETFDLRSINTVVKYSKMVEVTAEVDGKLTDLSFEEGDDVAADQVLATVNATAAELAVRLKEAEEKVAALNAANEVNMQDAVNTKEVAIAEANSFKELHRQRATSYWEMKTKELEAKRATLRVDLATMQQQSAKAEYVAKRSEREMAEFEVTRREIAAPFAGYVEERFAERGGWVQAGTPIARIVHLNRLRVQGDLDALRYPGRVTKGTPVQIAVFNRGVQQEPVTINGVLDFVSSEIDINGHYRVWVEIENQRLPGGDWAVKPGMDAEIVVLPRGQ